MTSRGKEKEIQRLWNWPGMTKTLGVSFDHSVLLLLCSKALGKLGDTAKKPLPLLWQSQTKSWSSGSYCHTSKLVTGPGTSSTGPSLWLVALIRAVPMASPGHRHLVGSPSSQWDFLALVGSPHLTAARRNLSRLQCCSTAAKRLQQTELGFHLG